MDRYINEQEHQGDIPFRLLPSDLREDRAVMVRLPVLLADHPMYEERTGSIKKFTFAKGATWVDLQLRERSVKYGLRNNGFFILRSDVPILPGYFLADEEWDDSLALNQTQAESQ